MPVTINGSGTIGSLTSQTFSDGTQLSSAYSLGMRNRIINGNFDIWQRGTSFTSTSVNEYSADRFRTEGYASSTTISQQAFTQGQTAVPGYPRYFCRVALTASNTAGYWAFQQRIEAPTNINGDGTYTLSFWIKATTGSVAAGTWSYGLNSLASGPALTTTWQKVTQTITLSAVAESSYISAYIFYLPINSAAVSVDIASVQVEYGSVSTPFERRLIGHELLLCQRYFEKSYAAATVPGTNTGPNTGEWVGVALNATDFYSFGQGTWKVTKRASPTMTLWSTDGTANAFRQQDAGNTNALVRMSSETSFALYSNNMTANNFERGHWTANAEL